MNQPIQLGATREMLGFRYEFQVVPVGAQGVGELKCKSGTRLHSVIPLPRGAIQGTPLQVLVVLEIEPQMGDGRVN